MRLAAQDPARKSGGALAALGRGAQRRALARRRPADDRSEGHALWLTNPVEWAWNAAYAAAAERAAAQRRGLWHPDGLRRRAERARRPSGARQLGRRRRRRREPQRRVDPRASTASAQRRRRSAAGGSATPPCAASASRLGRRPGERRGHRPRRPRAAATATSSTGASASRRSRTSTGDGRARRRRRVPLRPRRRPARLGPVPLTTTPPGVPKRRLARAAAPAAAPSPLGASRRSGLHELRWRRLLAGAPVHARRRARRAQRRPRRRSRRSSPASLCGDDACAAALPSHAASRWGVPASCAARRAASSTASRASGPSGSATSTRRSATASSSPATTPRSASAATSSSCRRSSPLFADGARPAAARLRLRRRALPRPRRRSAASTPTALTCRRPRSRRARTARVRTQRRTSARPQDVPEIAAGGFDVVTLWSVLAHLPRPVEDLTTIRAAAPRPAARCSSSRVNANSLDAEGERAIAGTASPRTT